ncbi:sugar phosphate isomerase/epimerase family protein [Anaerocolumna sp. MB42-C2]|uniref:sugar phosphate isomerase/epimerase family protein n=1 Tax=Anaerocolumna sp. MB42-C2 TaxID=3070997 RepID=UPI0027E17B88|nr:sugar phosphate isomerase/epimerase family protein [Anaerocolumna sp. MB42-C2]WMJ89712.1 sugar phosphate isomerase/epimerase family protein [Anaerocolumna sp. MB42-C2]
MILKFSCADFSFPLLKHKDVLKLIAMMGFTGVDIGLFEERSHLRPSTEFMKTEASAETLKKKLEETGLMAADIFMQTALDFKLIAPNHPDKLVRQKNRDLFLHTLEYASITGSEHITVLPGVTFEDEESEESLYRCYSELAWRVEKAKEYGLIFGIEAHVGSIADTPDKALNLLQNVPGLTLTLDYTHFTRCGIPDDQIAVLLPYASHFHARGAAPRKLQCRVSENTINYAGIIKQLKALNYKGYIGLEYTWDEWENCNQNDNVAESILLKKLIMEAYNE